MYATQAVTHFVPLAADLDQNKVTPGVLGFVVFAVMAGGVWLLMKSMSRHMGKVNFKEGPQKPETPGDRGPAEPAVPSAPASSSGSAPRGR
jgi:hypothetical protein